MPSRRRHAPDRTSTAASPEATIEAPDDETRRALALFNQRLAKDAEAERVQRNVERTARAKDDAAARVRALESDTKATAAERAEAAAAYQAALDAWDRARNGDGQPAEE